MKPLYLIGLKREKTITSTNKNCAVTSFWHGISAYFNYNDKSIVNFVVGTPACSSCIVCPSLTLDFNPLTINGNFRCKAPSTHGFIPQTYSDPMITDSILSAVGNGRPLMAFNLSCGKYCAGEILAARIVGAIGVTTEGRTNWQILVRCIGDWCSTNNSTKIRRFIEDNYPNSTIIAEYNATQAIQIVRNGFTQWFDLVNNGNNSLALVSGF